MGQRRPRGRREIPDGISTIWLEVYPRGCDFKHGAILKQYKKRKRSIIGKALRRALPFPHERLARTSAPIWRDDGVLMASAVLPSLYLRHQRNARAWWVWGPFDEDETPLSDFLTV